MQWSFKEFLTHGLWEILKLVKVSGSCDIVSMQRRNQAMLVLFLLLIAPMTRARIGEGGARKLDTRKCCLMTQVLVEKGPSQRAGRASSLDSLPSIMASRSALEMKNSFPSTTMTIRRLSATNWSWNPQGFWFTISQAARASGLEMRSIAR